MPMRNRKDNPHILHARDFDIENFPGHYYRGYVWDSVEAMREGIKDDEDDYAKAIGACTHAHYIQMIKDSGHAINKAPRRMGELHFVTQIWDAEVVSHECFHATTNICRICNVWPAVNIEYEEFGAYVQGTLTQAVYGWLWEVDSKHSAIGFIWRCKKKFGALWDKIRAYIVQNAPKTLS